MGRLSYGAQDDSFTASKEEIEEALRPAETRGWRVKQGGSHAGRIYCPYNAAERRCGEFCITSVWSTPKNPTNHTRAIKRVVDNCTFQSDKVSEQSTVSLKAKPWNTHSH
ncbi:hypothetical protein M0D69_32565 [Caballeronia sp. SEWSISQ10-4 2]|uniref:hypothetical protein n=1 Tax=Caballeronia sp. SEWSISQ10-4 2 TaxID=2937438 RepID=UPI00264FD09B|nr:hypothetical protein [Caballeronia sp. SEWSISQ10-4 2]MDN7182668.1 hypothetical protein [Caballeronia sp. SEWSISQ10-4 2]